MYENQPGIDSIINLKIYDEYIHNKGELSFPNVNFIDNNAKNYKNFHWALLSRNLKQSIERKFTLKYTANSYKLSNGEQVGLSNVFYVKLYNEADYALLVDVSEKYGVKIIGNNEFSPLWYVLMCINNENGNALELANKFKETNIFAASEPNLMEDLQLTCTDDPFFDDQWNLNNTGQNNGIAGYDIDFCHAMLRTTGNASIIVAVLDQGVELNHPDLPNMCSLSFDTESGTSPSQVRGSHGTACAGIIGAAMNTIGVTGIAPACPIMSISNSLAANATSQIARGSGFYFAANNGASIISCSWRSGAQHQQIDDGIRYALNNGRNGLGCVVVISAGNDDTSSVCYPANLTDSILCVGAMSPCGERKNASSCDGEYWWGSNYGPQIDVVAPGVFIPTTDRQGTAGYSASNYTPDFNGTSSACPHVAAVAALVLSRNPNLTQKEVCDIIERTARILKPEDYEYGYYYNRPNGPWNEEVGYGLVDAYAAVRQACTGTYTYQNHNVTSNTMILNCSLYVQNVTVSNNAHLTLMADQTITIDGPFDVSSGSTLDVKNEY